MHMLNVALHFAYYNFARFIRRSASTPAMESGLSDHSGRLRNSSRFSIEVPFLIGNATGFIDPFRQSRKRPFSAHEASDTLPFASERCTLRSFKDSPRSGSVYRPHKRLFANPEGRFSRVIWPRQAL